MEIFDGLKRRDFIKLSSFALGGIILTGCGSSSGSGGTSTGLPNGYTYHRIKNVGDHIELQSESFQINEFLGSAHIGQNGIITFDAEDRNKRRGIFQIGVDFTESRPKIDWEDSAVMTGERLIDDRVVSTWGNYDVDESGNIAALIDPNHIESADTHFGPGIYHYERLNSFKPVLIAGQEFNGGEIKSSGIFYCVSLNNNNMVASLSHLPTQGFDSKHTNSLLHIPNATLSSAHLLVSEGDYLTGTDHRVSSFGLLDHNRNGDFCSTVFTSTPALEATAFGTPSQLSSSLNFVAHVDSPGDHFVTTASPESGIGGRVASGEAGYASRLGPNGETFALLLNNGQISLVKDDQTILAIGEETTAGKILHIGTGSVGSDGIYYYSVRTDAADSALFAYNGREHIQLLSSGNILSTGGVPVARALFGTTKRHVDSEGRLVFCCTFTDGSTSLVVGIPS